MKTGSRSPLMAALAAGFLLLAGCTQIPQGQADADPLEPLNRGVFQFNRAVDELILRPVASIYRSVVPDKGREMVSNFLENLYVPVSVANSALQGDPRNTFANFWRFFINSAMGVGGLFDVASEAGLKARTTDFGQTLAIYGAEPGAYLVLPVIGPSNARDAVGRLADAFINPFNYVSTGVSVATWSATAVDKRSTHMKLIDDVYSSSLDPYATFRSGYTQHRAADIRRAKSERAASLEALCEGK